jgi:hypothetical protein
MFFLTIVKAEKESVFSYPTPGLFLKKDYLYFRDAVRSSNGICVKRVQRTGEIPAHKILFDKGERSLLVAKEAMPFGTFYAELSVDLSVDPTSENPNANLRHF